MYLGGKWIFVRAEGEISLKFIFILKIKINYLIQQERNMLFLRKIIYYRHIPIVVFHKLFFAYFCLKRRCLYRLAVYYNLKLIDTDF